jgi:hypothetical protein
MRVFAKPGSLERLSLEARIVYSFFLLFLLIGGASSVWLWIDDDLGASSAGARRYYLGDPAPAPAATEDPLGGPELDLPEMAAPLRLAKEPRQIMETFHFHLFSVSVCYLIVAHLFMMCSLATRTKALVIAAGGAATLLHLLAPPAIRFLSDRAAALMFPSALVMTLAWLWMTVQPLAEMWIRIPRAAPDEDR